MHKVHVKLPDGLVQEVEQGTTVEALAKCIHPNLVKRAVGGKINGHLVDVYTPILEDAEVTVVTTDMPQGLHMLRHSAAHLTAQALTRVFGHAQVQLGVGPVIADGFYYDVDVPRPITQDDLETIEAEMHRIVLEDIPITREVVSRQEAVQRFESIRDELKLELISDLPETAVISIYTQGEFFDLCKGPHVPSTGWLKAVKLLSVGGVYWRGDAKNKQLQRIYGTAFATVAELQEHLRLLEEVKTRDHRRLGKDLELFMFSEDAPGMPFYLPKGLIIRNELESFERKLQSRRGYAEVRTPQLMNQRLWEQSGHWGHYQENMYVSEVDGSLVALKPMSCPGHMLLYKNKVHSYRDLPIRMAEYGQCHRHELSGALNGMMRVRTFTQDDAHLFVRPDQIQSEIAGILDLIDTVYGVFGFPYHIELSTRPENSMGSDELWEQAERALQNVLESRGISYVLNEGDGAFYGPKIDFHIQDVLKRNWQCATVQLDFQLPERFDLTYVGEDNQKHRPVVIHRAIFGSVDRFLGILTEHYAGAFPLWLAPVQARLLPISDTFVPYASELQERLLDLGIRAEVDTRSEKIGYKIRQAQVEKIPYALVVGAREEEQEAVSVRAYGQGDLGCVPFPEFTEQLVQELRASASVIQQKP